MVKIKDVAEQCGVAYSTVSKALNGGKDVSTATRERIIKVAKSMGYVPNTHARALKTNRTYNLGLLFADKTGVGLAHEYFSGIINSIKLEADKHGYDITFASNNVGLAQMDYLEHAKYRNFDGIIIVASDCTNPELVKLLESDIPVVIIDQQYPNKTTIMSSNVQSMEDMVEYVHSQGHSKLAIIHGEDTTVTRNRLAGFYIACENNGIHIPDSNIKEAVYHDAHMTFHKTKELLALKDRPTCIFFQDDYSYIGGMNAILSENLKIPDDISVVGFDGINLSQIVNPKLTTYRQDQFEIGRVACDKLIASIEKPHQFFPEQIMIPGKLIIGDSVKKLL